jgi:hypothetical protein
MPLRLHAIVGPEEAATHAHEFAVGRMIDGLDPGNAAGDFRMRALDVRHEFFLRARRTGYENGAGILQGQGHTLEVFRIHSDVAAVTRIHFVMQVLLPVRTVDSRRIGVVRVEANDLGQLVIDPHHDVKVFAHILSCGFL